MLGEKNKLLSGFFSSSNLADADLKKINSVTES